MRIAEVVVMGSLSDEQIVARAIENGWVLEENERHNSLGPGGYWRREGRGIPFGTFRGPLWKTVDGKRVKVQDGPYTETPADAMRDALDDHDDQCQECGRWIEYGDYIGLERKHAPLSYCWDCNFWIDRVNRRDDPHIFVSQHHVWHGIGDRRTPSSHNGYGGSWFTVTFLDGRQVETCDLWNGGKIPERFRDRLPVTATLSRLDG